jgi:hypothetical protein
LVERREHVGKSPLDALIPDPIYYENSVTWGTPLRYIPPGDESARMGGSAALGGPVPGDTALLDSAIRY